MMETEGSSETTGCLISTYRRCVVEIFFAMCFPETSATNYRGADKSLARLLRDVFCLMVRILILMLLLLYV